CQRGNSPFHKIGLKSSSSLYVSLHKNLTNRIFRIAIQAESAVIIPINQQASVFGTDVSGQIFASPPKKFTGPIEAMRHPHFHDRASQEAAWQAVVKVAGVDFSTVRPASQSSPPITKRSFVL